MITLCFSQFYFMIIMLLIFTVIATTNGCLTYIKGDGCILAVCQELCRNTYDGVGFCQPSEGFMPKFRCLCQQVKDCPP